MEPLEPITAEHLRQTATAICLGLPNDELEMHPAYRAADRIEALQKERDESRRNELAAMKAALSLIHELKNDLDRLGRNRDMYKGQVDRQAEELAALRISVVGCPGCGSVEGQYHSPECPSVNAFTAGRIPYAGASSTACDDQCASDPGIEGAAQ